MNGWRPDRDLSARSFDLRFVETARPDGRLPLAAARNAGARTARSKNPVFLDVDCVPFPTLPASYGTALAGFGGVVMGEVRYLPPGAGGRFRSTGDFSELSTTGAAHPARKLPPRTGIRRTGRYQTF